MKNEQKALEAAAKGGKAKKFKKSSPPDKGFVMWNEDTFKKGETGAPETLDSSFEVALLRDDFGGAVAPRRRQARSVRPAPEEPRA